MLPRLTATAVVVDAKVHHLGAGAEIAIIHHKGDVHLRPQSLVIGLTNLEIKNSDKFRHDAQNADNARKNTAFPPVCKKCAKVCRAPESGKSTMNLTILR